MGKSEASSDNATKPKTLLEDSVDNEKASANPENKPLTQNESENSAAKIRHAKDVDHGYAWVIMASVVTQLFFMFYVLNSFPVLFVEFVEYFKAGRGQIAWIGSAQTATVFLVGECKHLYLGGWGCTCCYT